MKINSLTFNKGKENECDFSLSQLVVIVGPNRTGKTKLLEELNDLIINPERHYPKGTVWDVVIGDQNINLADYKSFIDSCEPNSDYLKPGSPIRYASVYTQGGVNITEEEYRNAQNDATILEKIDLNKELESYLAVNNRTDQVAGRVNIAPDSSAKLSFVELLWRTPHILKRLNQLTETIFQKKMLITPHMMPTLQAFLLDTIEDTPNECSANFTYEDRRAFISWQRGNELWTLSDESHGIKAAFTIFEALLTPTKSLLLIDEPELHLYPNVKRKIGRLIAQVSKEGKQIICVTHDSEILEGILQEEPIATILKTSRKGNDYSITDVSFQKSQTLRPNQRKKDFMAIPFLDFVVIVEGTNDKIIYEYIYETYLANQANKANKEGKHIAQYDVGFIWGGGKDELNNPEYTASRFQTPYAMVVDFDFFRNEAKTSKYLLLKDERQIEWMGAASGVSSELAKCLQDEEWKKSGVNAVQNDDLKKEVKRLISKAKRFGLFIVPTGSVEHLALLDSLSEEQKYKAADIFLNNYDSHQNDYNELNDFVESIKEYIESNLAD